MRSFKAWRNLRGVRAVGSDSVTPPRTPVGHLRLRRVLGAFGPGLLTALAGMDAGGVATFSNAGATFGFGQLWSIPLMCFLLIVVQETAARMGCVTGKGFSSLIRVRFGLRRSAFAMLALIVSNTMVTISEFAGIASGMQLFGVPTFASVPIAAIAVWLLGVSESYRRVERILLVLGCVFVTYVAASFMVRPDWGEVARSTFLPHVSLTPAYVSLLVANIGTTISPYMIFMGQGNVVEKGCSLDDLPYQRIDTVSGAVVAQLIAFFIVVCTGSTLHPEGVVVSSAADAARALVPIAGPYAELLFGVGLVGASFLAACVLPGITSSAVCEAFGWEFGQNSSWADAPTYHAITTAVTLLSAAVVLIPGVDLFGIMMVAQVINGILLPVLLVFMVLVASDRHVMGAYANSRTWTLLTWLIVGVVMMLTVVMLVLQTLGY